MRIVVEKIPAPAQEREAVAGQEAAATEKRSVTYGKEDLILVFGVALILFGLWFGKLTFEQALAYIGVSTSGGVWGLLSGNASK
jgi:hypothetical protein